VFYKFLCFYVCFSVYGPFCHGALSTWHVYIVYNILSLNISSIYYILMSKDLFVSMCSVGAVWVGPAEASPPVDDVCREPGPGRVPATLRARLCPGRGGNRNWWVWPCPPLLFKWNIGENHKYNILSCSELHSFEYLWIFKRLCNLNVIFVVYYVLFCCSYYF